MFLFQDLDVIKSPRSRGVYGYQDFESIKNLTYCKASDVFSLACVLFEMLTGSYLLRYVCDFEKNVDRERNEYLNVFQEGRISGIQRLLYPYDGVPRMMLSDRVKESCIRLYPLILLMIEPRSTRITLPQIMSSGSIESERDILGSKSWKLDNGKKFTFL